MAAPPLPDDEQLRNELGLITEKGALSRRAAVKQLADRYGVAANELYELLQSRHKDGHKT